MYYLGVDVGGTNIAVGIVDENNAIIAKASHPTPVPCSEDAFCDAILAVCNDALAKAGLTLDDVPWIGIGCPGTVNRATGIIEFANNLYFKNFKLRDMMAERTNGKLVILENDANAAAYGEYQAGALAGADNALAITLGTGVGGGIVFNGKVWNGFHGVGSEIGHMILELDGEPCTCGNYGCVERYCSATAIIRMARELCAVHPESEIVKVCEGDLNRVNAKVVFDAAKNGDEIALKVFHRYVKYLGQLVASLVNCIDPEVIVLGGGVSKAGDFLLDAVRAETRRYVLYKTLPSARIELAKLGPDAGIIGAAAL